VSNLRFQFHTLEFQFHLWYNTLVPMVRNSPPECRSALTSCRAAGLVLLALPTSLQVRQLACVVEDSHRVGHDPQKVVYDAQEVVGVYHLFLLRAYCPESARRIQRRAVFARRQARNTPRKPAPSFSFTIPTCHVTKMSAVKTRSHLQRRRQPHKESGTERGSSKSHRAYNFTTYFQYRCSVPVRNYTRTSR
jgi:hypothetical protein